MNGFKGSSPRAIGIASLLGLMVAFVVTQILARDERTRGRPRFTVSQDKKHSGAHVVRLVHGGGHRIRKAEFSLQGLNERVTHEDFRFGDEITIRYYPSLVDEVPTHVRVAWSGWSGRKFEVVEII